MVMRNVVVMGGGSGTSAVIKSLKGCGVMVSAIVSMADDGGSTGVIKAELGTNSTGDVRKCIAAMASPLIGSVMNYRFRSGMFRGHNAGNLMLASMEKIVGDCGVAAQEVGRALSIDGSVIPVTTGKPSLKMKLISGKVLVGEREICMSDEIDKGYESLYMDPDPDPNPHVFAVLSNADVVIVCPGGWHTSIIPIFLVRNVSSAFEQCMAKKVIITNLVNKKGQTTGYKASDYIAHINKYVGATFDVILANDSEKIDRRIHGDFVINDLYGNSKVVTADMMSMKVNDEGESYLMERNAIVHNQYTMGEALKKIVGHI